MVPRHLAIVFLLALLWAGNSSAQEKKLEPLIVSYSSSTGNRAPFKYMRVDNPKLLDFTYKVQFLEAIPARPYPREDAVQTSIEDLRSTIAKLDGMKAVDFIDPSLIKEIDNKGFFAKWGKS